MQSMKTSYQYDIRTVKDKSPAEHEKKHESLRFHESSPSSSVKLRSPTFTKNLKELIFYKLVLNPINWFW